MLRHLSRPIRLASRSGCQKATTRVRLLTRAKPGAFFQRDQSDNVFRIQRRTHSSSVFHRRFAGRSNGHKSGSHLTLNILGVRIPLLTHTSVAKRSLFSSLSTRRAPDGGSGVYRRCVGATVTQRRWFAAPNPNPAKDYYKTLELSKTADAKQIKSAYLRLVKKWHPDVHATKSAAEKTTAKEKFQEIYEAYEVLTDANAKAEYDDMRRRGVRQAPPRYPAAGDRQQHYRHPGFSYTSQSQQSQGDWEREFRTRMQNEYERIRREQTHWAQQRQSEFSRGGSFRDSFGFDRGGAGFGGAGPGYSASPIGGMFRMFLSIFLLMTMFRLMSAILFGPRQMRQDSRYADPWYGGGQYGHGGYESPNYKGPWEPPPMGGGNYPPPSPSSRYRNPDNDENFRLVRDSGDGRLQQRRTRGEGGYGRYSPPPPTTSSGLSKDSPVTPPSYGSEQHATGDKRREDYVRQHSDVKEKAEYVRQLKERAENERRMRHQKQARRDSRARDFERRTGVKTSYTSANPIEWDEGMREEKPEHKESANDAWTRRLNSPEARSGRWREGR